MSWNQEMCHAYSVGLEDGLSGHRRGRPNDFEGCYEQGWQHGKETRLTLNSQAYTKAHKEMRACLTGQT
jgi:hypothetical protein